MQANNRQAYMHRAWHIPGETDNMKHDTAANTQ